MKTPIKEMAPVADNVMDKRTDGMNQQVKSNRWMGSVMKMALMVVLILTMFALPQNASAQPNKGASKVCGSCHNGTALNAGMTVDASVDGVEGTNFSVSPGATIEIDWVFRGMRGSTPTRGVTAIMGLPAGWTPQLTTNGSNPATLGGTAWSTWWDNAMTKGTPASSTPTWQVTAAEAGAPPPNGMTSTNVYKMLMEGSEWESGSGSTADGGNGTDLDGVTDVMGADVRVTVPASGGPWTVYLGGVGHDTGAKAMVTKAITISLVGGDATAPVPNNDVAVSVESGAYVPAAFDVTATFAEPEGNVTGCEYTLNNGGAWSAGSVSGAGPYTCTANVTGQTNGSSLDISMRMTSFGGTSVASTYYPLRTVDAAAPTTTDDVPVGWQTADVTVTLTPADAGSGVASTVYCVDQVDSCIPGTPYAGGFLVSTEDTNYVRYSSTDNLGNAQTVVSKTLQIDKTVPTDGVLSTVPGDSQVQLNWTAASDATSGLDNPAYKVVMATGTTTPPVDCSGGAIYTGNLLTHTQTGLTNGLDYAFRVCAYDVAGLVSVGTTDSAQPSLVCTNADPTIAITTNDQQITAGSGSVVYNVDVTNNDSVSCGDTTFTLSANDGNATDFAASVLGTTSLLVSAGTTNNTTMTVTAVASPTNGSTNLSWVTSAAAGPHGAATSGNAQTLINIPGTATKSYNVGDQIHFEYRTTTRFTNTGTNALFIKDSSKGTVLTASMVEVQQGATWIYTYDWDSTGQPLDTYSVEISDSDLNPTAMSVIVLGNATPRINFFADAGYTTPSNVFADSDTVYVEVQLPASESTTLASEVTNYYGTFWSPALNVTQTGTTYRFNFVVDFVSSAVADGDWGFYYWEGNDTGIFFHEPIKRSDAGCGTCTYTDPTVAILTGNQTISTEAGSVDYTINITNNDTVACGSTAFDLTAFDTDTTVFAAAGSIFGTDPLNVAPGSTGSTVLTVAAQAGNYTGSNDSYFYTVADVNHGQSLNSNTVTTTLDVPDTTPPSILITAPTNGSYINAAGAEPIVVSGTASDDRGTVTSLDVQIDGGIWNAASTSDGYANWTWNWAGAADGAHTIDARASDGTNTGNATQISVTVDRTDPTTSDNVIAAWTGTDRTVTLIEADATSGISSTDYCVDTTNSCVPGTAYAAPFAVNQVATQENLQYVRYFSTDNAGNSQTLVSTVVRIDKKAPVDGAAVTPTSGDTQIQLNWNAATDGGSGLEAVNTYKVVRVAGTTPPADCSAAGVYTGSALTFTDTGLTNGNDYAYRVCAYDNVGQVSTGLTTTAQPAAACVRTDPTVSLSASQDITADGGFVDYTVTVTNNDSGGCAAQTFDIETVTDNGVSFTLSFPNGLTTGSIGTGASDTSLVARVTANGGALNSATHIVGVRTDNASDPNHGASLEAQATTTMNVPCNIAPTISWLTANQGITTDGGNAVYNIQVQNDNAVACGSTNFDLVLVDDNAVAFATPSVFGTDPLTVAPNGGTNTTTITVTSEVGAANFATNNTYFYTAVNGTIPTSGNSPTRTTTLNRPCTNNPPSFNHAVNQNVAPDGTAVYTLTIINNDVDCTDSTWTFGIDSEVESSVGTFTLPSTFSSPTVTVASGATSSTVTFSVVGNGTGIEGDTLTSTIRITDATSHNGQDQTTAPLTTIKPFDPLIHSSASTGSTKHSGSWGVVGGTYGEFTCATCHSPSTTNSKRIATTINAPGEAIHGRPVTFLDATANNADPASNPADFGDDSTAPRGSSNKICEVCHTYDVTKANGVIFHAYDQQVAAGHEDDKDCTACHKHNDGFSKAGATCDGCHGYPPSPGDATTSPARADDGFGYQAVEGKGAHVEHVNHLATLAGVTLDPNTDSFGDPNVTAVCGVCHSMAGVDHEMSGGAAANRNINFNGSPTFQFGGSAPAYNGVEDDPSATTPKTCSNINCHYQATPWWE
jgi:hypothetical protein